MITHFIADTHFGHENVIQHAKRPFMNVHEMDAELERRYVETVKPTDVVAWVGDVSFKDYWTTKSLLERLPGHKILIRGNHDGSITNCLKLGFVIVVDFMHLWIHGHKVTVSHYPPAGSNPDVRFLERRPPKPQAGEFILHGHTHEQKRRIGRRLHVGVDAWSFYPAPMSEIIALVAGKETE